MILRFLWRESGIRRQSVFYSMDSFERKVQEYMQEHEMLTQGDTIVLGVSGGADSVALLLVFCELRPLYDLALKVVHVHHGIRAEADGDADYVRDLCGKLDVPFTLVYKNIPEMVKQQGRSGEELGRQVRYEAFRQALGDCRGSIAVAHHQSDQAETVLHNLLRGTGLAGLKGMVPRKDGVIRPFLGVTRQELEQYLERKKIPYRTDATNLTDDYTRNRIRHHLLGYATTQINDRATEHIALAAEHVRQACEYLDRQIEEAKAHCVLTKEPLTIDLDRFLTLDPFLQKQLILSCVDRDFEAKHLALVFELLGKEGEKHLALPGGLTVIKQYRRLIFDKSPVKKELSFTPVRLEPPCELTLPDGAVLELSVFDLPPEYKYPQNPYTKWFDYDKIEQSLWLRTRQSGDYLCVNDALSTKSLKAYMIQEKIPRSMREQTLLLVDGAHVMWVIGHRISAKYKVGAYTKRILAVNLRGGH